MSSLYFDYKYYSDNNLRFIKSIDNDFLIKADLVEQFSFFLVERELE